MTKASQLRTFLWFNNNLGEALEFYKETFGANLVIQSSGSPDESGKLMTAEFSIYGHDLVGMGWPGGDTFNNSISLAISCDGQEEVDRLWNAITKDGKAGQCGWCVDAFGVNWQITPFQMGEYLGSSDPEQQAYAWQAMRSMGKIILKDFIKP